MFTALVALVVVLLWAGIIVIFKTANGEYRAEEARRAELDARYPIPTQAQLDAAYREEMRTSPF